MMTSAHGRAIAYGSDLAMKKLCTTRTCALKYHQAIIACTRKNSVGGVSTMTAQCCTLASESHRCSRKFVCRSAMLLSVVRGGGISMILSPIRSARRTTASLFSVFLLQDIEVTPPGFFSTKVAFAILSAYLFALFPVAKVVPSLSRAVADFPFTTGGVTFCSKAPTTPFSTPVAITLL